MPGIKLLKIRKKATANKTRSSHYVEIDWEKAKTIFEKPILKPCSSSKYPSAKDILSILAKLGALGLILAFPGASAAIGNLEVVSKP